MAKTCVLTLATLAVCHGMSSETVRKLAEARRLDAQTSKPGFVCSVSGGPTGEVDIENPSLPMNVANKAKFPDTDDVMNYCDKNQNCYSGPSEYATLMRLVPGERAYINGAAYEDGTVEARMSITATEEEIDEAVTFGPLDQIDKLAALEDKHGVGAALDGISQNIICCPADTEACVVITCVPERVDSDSNSDANSDSDSDTTFSRIVSEDATIGYTKERRFQPVESGWFAQIKKWTSGK